jgi:hypothetical protein
MKALDALAAAGTLTLVIERGRVIVSGAGVTFGRVAFLKTLADYHHMIAMEMGVVFYEEPPVALPARHWAIATAPNRRDAAPFETFIAGNLRFDADIAVADQGAAAGPAGARRHPDHPQHGRLQPDLLRRQRQFVPRPARILVDADGAWTYVERATPMTRFSR